MGQVEGTNEDVSQMNVVMWKNRGTRAI